MNYPIKASLLPAIFFAVIVVVFLFAVQLFLFPDTNTGMFYRIVWGNYISPVILVIFFTAVFLLLSKQRKLNYERKMSHRFMVDVGPKLFDNKTRVEDVADKFSAFKQNLLVHRWQSLQLQAPDGHTSELDVSGSANEMEHLQNSYSLPRFFVWALPIVGFIGTVWGIGLSISFFSDTMSSSQAGASVSSLLQQNIPLVTKGLSTAFDTTLLALALSVPATGLLVLTERNEREYLLGLDEQWRDFIATRPSGIEEMPELDIDLVDQRSHAQAVGESLRDLREDAFDRHQQRFSRGE